MVKLRAALESGPGAERAAIEEVRVVHLVRLVLALPLYWLRVKRVGFKRGVDLGESKWPAPPILDPMYVPIRFKSF